MFYAHKFRMTARHQGGVITNKHMFLFAIMTSMIMVLSGYPLALY